MNEQKREQLSALMDDELGHESSSAIDTLMSDKEAKDTWDRYHLIGETMRGNLPEQVSSIAEQVSQAIDAEPTVLAPKKTPVPLMKPVMGFAIAASVAAVAIFNVQQAKRSPEIGLPSIEQTSLATNTVAPSIATPQLVLQQQNEANQNLQSDPRLNRYLVNYNEYRANTGLSGMPPHVRMVANDSASIRK